MNAQLLSDRGWLCVIILDDHVETASKHTPIKAIEIQGFGDAWLESQSKTVEKWSGVT